MPHPRFQHNFRRAIVASLFLGTGLQALAGFTLTNLPDYRIGETVRVDFLAPVAMTVIDPEVTETLRFKEAMKVPAIYRMNSNVVAEAEATLRQSLAANRENFLNYFEVVYQTRKVPAPLLAQPRFSKTVETYQRENKLFPLTTNLARLWALGDSDETVVGPWSTKLRELMARPIRAEELTNENKFGPGQFRLITTQDPDRLNLTAVEAQFKPLPRSSIIPLARLAGDFQKSLPPEERAAGKFLVLFLKANCVLDEELTRQARLKKTEAIWWVKHYEAGEAIVYQGEVVDGKMRAAFDQLRAQAAVVELNERAAASAALPPKREWPRAALWTGATALCVLSGWLVWRRLTRAKSSSLALTRISSGAESGGTAGALTRSELMPLLARFLSQAVVQRLFRQRTLLVQTQELAAAQTVELEERLTKIQSHMQERFRAYEHRISELEEELAAAEEQNRDLIRAKIVLAKQDLEFERAKNRLARN